uniref:Serpentine receptor class gamma n=1 Tax=Caenorhabditis tropicalis TaxID=1561998 RepID=A0A1I7V2L3_9PELO
MGMIWKVTVVLPIPIMCSNSFTAEYAPIVFQFLPACLVYTGVSIVLLFIYRMEAIVFHKEETFGYRRKMVHWSKNLFFLSVVILLILSILIYPDLKYQVEYKQKMEERFGKFKGYMWCDNCFFFNFDSKLFKSFYVAGAVTAALGGFTAGMAFHVTVRVLKSAAIHGICILLPLLGLLCAISIVITLSQFPYFPYLLVLIIQEHGALSTITMFLTNDLLRRTLFRMFSGNRVADSLIHSENNRSTNA